MVEGERVLGRFTIGERIGRGGYGTVHRAWDERLCRDVAVKSVEGSSAGRVLREAHAAARLNHPGIVTLYELGEENGCTYLVSELVKGPNLRELATAGGLSDRELAEIGVELCGALAHAHAQGVVHRDIKPDNVLVRRGSGRRMRAAGERALLADFGIASIADEPSLTATGQVVGTLAYMAPEQAAGEEATTASDVYALALTLFELWAGENPVAAATPAATARRIGSELPSLDHFRPELPAALVGAIDAGLRPDPAERPGLGELASALQATEGALHPDRALPEPEHPVAVSSLPDELPARPFAVLLACGALAALGLLTGLPGLAVVAAVLFAPAALALSQPREWALPALAPILGLVGLAPAFLVIAAAHSRSGGRAVLAALGWAWTGLAGVALGHELGVLGATAAGDWTGSGPDAFAGLLEPLLGADALATGLIWAGSAVLLGAILEFAGPALLALLGLVWSAGVVASLGAVGGTAAPDALLAPALIGSILWLSWDRAGRPMPEGRERSTGPGFGPWLTGMLAPSAAETIPRAPRPPRNPAEAPLADSHARATRAASRHVSAALHGAGSRPRLP